MRSFVIATFVATFLFSGCSTATGHAVKDQFQVQSQATWSENWTAEEFEAHMKWLETIRFDYYFVVAREDDGIRLWVRLADINVYPSHKRWEELSERHDATTTVFMMPSNVNTIYKEFRVPHAVDQPIIITAEKKDNCKFEVGVAVECCNYVEKGVGPGTAYRASFLTHYKELECEL